MEMIILKHMKKSWLLYFQNYSEIIHKYVYVVCTNSHRTQESFDQQTSADNAEYKSVGLNYS